MLKIVIPGDPVGKGRPRASTISGRARLYTPKKTADYEQRVKAIAHAAMCGVQPATGPVEAEIWAMTAPPASWSKKKKLMALDGDLLPESKPDLDNVAKIILDSLNGIAYLDDKQVTDLTIKRRYSATPAVVAIINKVVI